MEELQLLVDIGANASSVAWAYLIIIHIAKPVLGAAFILFILKKFADFMAKIR